VAPGSAPATGKLAITLGIAHTAAALAATNAHLRTALPRTTVTIPLYSPTPIEWCEVTNRSRPICDDGPVSGFARLWTASTVSDFGSYITALALPLLVLNQLHGTATDVGLVNGARWLAYLLFGLLAGVFVDRHRRLPILVGTDLGRAVLLGVIPLLTLFHRLTVPTVIVLMIPFGVLSVLNDAAEQSFLPRLVTPAALGRANVRLEQSRSAAVTTGPLVGGALVAALGASLTVLVDAVSYLFSGFLLATIRIEEQPKPVRRRLLAELRDGVRWVYRHPMLAPMALTSHGWFVFNSMLTTVLIPFAVHDAGLGPLGIGIVLACSGVGGVLGGTVSSRVAAALGAGPAVVFAQALFPVAFTLVVLAPHGWLALVLIAAGMSLFGLGVGVGSPIEQTYRQQVTPDGLQGRMIATMRSFNWGMNAIGAPVGGLLADRIGYRPTLWIGIGGVAAMAVAIGCSRFRHASLADTIPAGHAAE
jgi:predicted MFS family arabinose efflux permease